MNANTTDGVNSSCPDTKSVCERMTARDYIRQSQNQMQYRIKQLQILSDMLPAHPSPEQDIALIRILGAGICS
jgi:hypothetical protein